MEENKDKLNNKIENPMDGVEILEGVQIENAPKDEMFDFDTAKIEKIETQKENMPNEESIFDFDINKTDSKNYIDNIEKEESAIKPQADTFDQNTIEKIIEEKNFLNYNLETNEESLKQNETNAMITVRPVKFQNFDEVVSNLTIKKNLDIMQDISMKISVELGRTKTSVKEIIEMTKGSIIELNKIAGEQVEIFVNNKLVAKGEVIVIEDKFGVRVTNTSLPKDII